MSFDLSIEARRIESSSGRCVSSGHDNCDEENIGFFDICFWENWAYMEIMKDMIVICNKHLSAAYTYWDRIIPVPQTALREIYGYLLSGSYYPDDEDVEGMTREFYEKFNLENACKLHDIICELYRIEHDNICETGEEWFADKETFNKFQKDPQSYVWEFRLRTCF